VGLLLGCGLRRSEVIGLTQEQLQMREGRWVIVDLIGKGRWLRIVPVPSWSKQLLDAWLLHSGVSEGRVFRRVSKMGRRQQAGVTANVVWYAVKRCARQAGISHLAPHDLRRTCARLCHDCSGELEQIRFLLAMLRCRQRSDISTVNRNWEMRLMIVSKSQWQATLPESIPAHSLANSVLSFITLP